MATEPLMKPPEYVTHPVHPNIKELLILLGYTTQWDYTGDDIVRQALKDFLELKSKQVLVVGPPQH